MGFDGVTSYLENRNLQNSDVQVCSQSILDSLEFCLDNNYFNFGNKVYRQCGGVGTGLKLAPPYACLGVGKFEENVFNNPNNEFRDSILLWKRFIDDVLMLFKGTKEECRQFVEWLNSLLPGVIKFKYEYSSKKIEFLDLELSIENGTMETNL